MILLSKTLVDGVMTLSMQDQQRRNALSAAMLDELIAAFHSLSRDTRVVILRASPGNPVWCAGFDIRALDIGHDPLAQGGHLQRLFDCLAWCSAPVLGMVHGSTWGGGTDLALRCDILIGDETSKFAFTPARLGLPYDAGGLLNVLLRVGSNVALEMFATADPIEADRALRCGILNHLVASPHLEEFTIKMARRIAENAPLSVTSAKAHLRALGRAVQLSTPTAQALQENRVQALVSDDYAEGIAAFKAKRTPRFNGI